jgi:SET domain-containing protein
MAKEINRLNSSHHGYRITCLPPAWHAFITLCESIKYGEIEKLSIQDGLPCLAEEVRKKTKFNKN